MHTNWKPIANGYNLVTKTCYELDRFVLFKQKKFDLDVLEFS